MPTTRKRRGTKVRAGLTPAQIRYLWDGLLDPGEEVDKLEALLLRRDDEPCRRLWEENRDEVLAGWIAGRPGSRPTCWWLFDSPRQPAGRYPGFWFDGHLPEPRQQVGGAGQAPWDAGLAYYPEFVCGLPAFWETYDQDNPPLFETQASYLKRHGMLTPGERRKLTPADFEPIIWHDELGPARPENLHAFVREMKEKGRWLGR